MEEKKGKKRKTAIYFTTALKTDKNGEKINIKQILEDTKGFYEIYAIIHKKGTEEEHKHFWIKAKTPRTLENIANIFNVDQNFIEYIRNPRSQLRYLTHLDEETKEKYNFNEVLTNSKISYEERINTYEITKRELFTEFLNTENLEKTLYNYVETLNSAELYSIYKLAKEVKIFNKENNIQQQEEKQKNIEIYNYINEITVKYKKAVEEIEQLKKVVRNNNNKE